MSTSSLHKTPCFLRQPRRHLQAGRISPKRKGRLFGGKYFRSPLRSVLPFIIHTLTLAIMKGMKRQREIQTVRVRPQDRVRAAVVSSILPTTRSSSAPARPCFSLKRGNLTTEQMRFTQLREARLASAIDHPNVCAIYDVGEAPAEKGEGEEAYIVMQYIPGKVPRQFPRRRPCHSSACPLSRNSDLRWSSAACHLGIFHRDLKPATEKLTGRWRPHQDPRLRTRPPPASPTKPVPDPASWSRQQARSWLSSGCTRPYVHCAWRHYRLHGARSSSSLVVPPFNPTDIFVSASSSTSLATGRHPFHRPDAPEFQPHPRHPVRRPASIREDRALASYRARVRHPPLP